MKTTHFLLIFFFSIAISSLVFIGCARPLFVSYHGWLEDGSSRIGWAEIESVPVKDAAQLKVITENLEKDAGFKKVIILNFKRFE